VLRSAGISGKPPRFQGKVLRRIITISAFKIEKIMKMAISKGSRFKNIDIRL
jgi:hypothetical protein